MNSNKDSVHVHGVCSPASLRCLCVWSFQWLSSGGIPAPSAFSRENHAGAAASPTAKSLKWRSHSANIVTRGSKPHEHVQDKIPQVHLREFHKIVTRFYFNTLIEQNAQW